MCIRDRYKGEVFPVPGATTFVWTHHPGTGEKQDGVEYLSGEPEDVVKEIEKKGYKECVLAGGSTTNNEFVAAGLVDEITATIYPLLFGNGMRLLSADNIDMKLELIESTNFGDGVIRNSYKVVKHE